MTNPAKVSRLYGGVHADERRAERRLRLIEAAVQVYGRVGYRNATVKAVCEAAKLTERYFYESFANSEALLIAAYIHVTDELHRQMAAAGVQFTGDAAGRTRAILAVYFTRLREHPRPARVFLLEMGGISTEVDAVRMNALKAMSALLAPPVKGATETSMLSVGMVGAVINIALRWVSQGYPQPIDEVVTTAAVFCDVALAKASGRK
jgi:AcrR family transcriptional regulator